MRYYKETTTNKNSSLIFTAVIFYCCHENILTDHFTDVRKIVKYPCHQPSSPSLPSKPSGKNNYCHILATYYIEETLPSHPCECKLSLDMLICKNTTEQSQQALVVTAKFHKCTGTQLNSPVFPDGQPMTRKNRVTWQKQRQK